MNVFTKHHPKALPFLFLTEMWERFGFYLTQGLLVLYMTQFYGFSDEVSYTISGVFSGLVYISPFLGGLIADKLLGFRTSIIYGGILLITGYFFLSLSSVKGMFYVALATIIVGNGLLKPNISSILGSQYDSHDPRRDSGFTIFYIGINLGVALSGLSGYVKQAFGWHVAFSLASVGMVIGVIIFLSGSKYIKDTQLLTPIKTKLRYQFFLYCLLAILIISLILKVHAFAELLLPIAGLLLLLFLIGLVLQLNGDEQKQMIVLNILILSSIIFWMLFFQLFNSANLFIDRLVNKDLFGIHLTTTVFYASEGIFIIIFGPMFAWLWHTLGHLRKNPSAITKFIFGLFFTGLSFLVLSISANFPDYNGLINPLWIFFAYLLLTFGELFLSPIGLSAVTSLAPPHLAGMMMGIWFVAMGFGGLFAGLIAKLSIIPDPSMSVAAKLTIYQNAFINYAYIALFITLVLLLVRIWIKKIMRA